MLLKSSQATSRSSLLYLTTSFSSSVSVKKTYINPHTSRLYTSKTWNALNRGSISQQTRPMDTVMWSLPLADFFQGIMIEDLLLHFWKAVKIATRKREHAMVPVNISRTKSQAGFDAPWCLYTTSAGRFFELGPEWALAGGAPPT